MYRILNLNSWDEYIAIVPKLFKNYVFRGQQDSTWELKTSYERSGFMDIGITENELCQKFTYTASTLRDVQIPDSELELLALMQHQGLPTRLLDFSFSPFIAAYFAFEPHYNSFSRGIKEQKKVSIWAINHVMIYGISSFDLANCFTSEDVLKFKGVAYDDDYYKKVRYSKSIMRDTCFLCAPRKGNTRLINQQGIFLTHNSKDKFLHDVLINDKENASIFPDLVYQINIPVEESKKALKILFQMNIRPSVLFPGLDGIAKDVKIESSLINNEKTVSLEEVPSNNQNFIDNYKDNIQIID